MRNKNNGFTLIELVMVIVILSVLSAIALPKFINLQSDAQNAATAGVAGALSSASAVNYAARSVSANAGVSIGNCNQANLALLGSLPTGYSLSAGAVGSGSTATCTLTGPNSTSAVYTVIGA